MSKLILEGYIVVPNSDLAQVLAELPAHIELTRNEAGCLCFEVSQSLEAANVSMFMKSSLIGAGLKRTSNALNRLIGLKPLRMSKSTTK